MKRFWVKTVAILFCLGLLVSLAVGCSPEELEEISKAMEKEREKPEAEAEDTGDSDNYQLDYYARPADTPWETGGGQVSADPYIEDGIYAAGSGVTMIQQADEGFEFSHWEVWKNVDGEMVMVESSTDHSLPVTIDANTSVDAIFKTKE